MRQAGAFGQRLGQFLHLKDAPPSLVTRSLRGMLPEPARPTLEIVDDSNNKVYLVRAQL